MGVVATPVITGLLATGAVALTLGANVVPLLNPRMGSLPPPHAERMREDTRTSSQVVVSRKMEGRIKGLRSRCSEIPEVKVEHHEAA